MKKMHSGDIYFCNDEELSRRQLACLEKLYDYNATRPSQGKLRAQLLKDMFAQIGDGCYIEPPLHAKWAGAHVHFGNNVYANFNLTLVDDTHIYVGDGTMFGLNVVIATAGHPILPELRERVGQFNMPVHIGKKLLAGRRSYCFTGCVGGRQYRYRRRQRCQKRYSRKRSCARQSVPRSA